MTLKRATLRYAKGFVDPSKWSAWIKCTMTLERAVMNEKRLVTVCDKCLRACCWQGIFMCDDARDAGTVEKPIEELTGLGLEHSDYWKESAQ